MTASREDFATDDAYVDYLMAYEIRRRLVVVTSFGWTLEELERSPRKEVDELLIAKAMELGVQQERMQRRRS